MKILYLVTLSELGGAQRYVLDLARHLGDQFNITVAAGGNGELFEQLKNNQISTVRLKNLVREINPLKDLLALFEIYQLIKKEKPDILHLNSSKAGVLGAIAGRLLTPFRGVRDNKDRTPLKRLRIIYTVHGFVFNEPMPAWKKLLYIWLEKFSANFKNVLICVSEYDRLEGLKHKIAPAEKLITIHNGINTDPLNFLSKEEARKKIILSYKLPAFVPLSGTSAGRQVTSYKFIGAIANFYPAKGLLYFIQAAHRVIRQYSDAKFIIIGEGDQRAELEAEIKKLQLEKNFQLLGAINNAAKFLPAFDIYVCSSVKEGFPYSILEAMAARLPIIATAVGGIPEMIEDQKNGMLITPKNPEALANAIIRLLNNKKTADTLAAAAASTVLTQFGWKKMVEKTAAIYQTN